VDRVSLPVDLACISGRYHRRRDMNAQVLEKSKRGRNNCGFRLASQEFARVWFHHRLKLILVAAMVIVICYSMTKNDATVTITTNSIHSDHSYGSRDENMHSHRELTGIVSAQLSEVQEHAKALEARISSMEKQMEKLNSKGETIAAAAAAAQKLHQGEETAHSGVWTAAEVVPMSVPPPEPLDKQIFCAEQCRFDQQMCRADHVYSQTSFPAPTCASWSTDLQGDLYYHQQHTEWWRHRAEFYGWDSEVAMAVPVNDTARKEALKRVEKRNHKTVELVAWGAQRARERWLAMVKRLGGRNDRDSWNGAPQGDCADLARKMEMPMMFADEFEFAVKTMINRKPETYLEWGCGKSTSFYPLLASKKAHAIDNYPEWCETVRKSPVVRCLEDAKRLQFFCETVKWPNGTDIPVGKLGLPINKNDTVAAAMSYVNFVDKIGLRHYDVALVDGRFRVACALKLLGYLDRKSILFVHDFWERALRLPDYREILKWYDVIGRTRSIAAFRMKRLEDMPNGGRDHKEAYVAQLKRLGAA